MARLDITFGRPELRAVKKAALRRDLPALGAVLTAGLAGPDDHIERVRVAADTLTEWTGKSVPEGLDDWVRDDPDNPTALVVRGAVEINRAWEVRGRLQARYTKPQQLLDFISILGNAEAYCRAAAQSDPGDAAPWLFLLSMARGQQVGTDEVVRRRDELEARAPQSFVGHRHAIAALGPQWGGSMQAVDKQVRTWTAEAPAGSLLPALVFVAGIQRWWSHGHRRAFARDPERRAQAYRASGLLPMQPCQTPDEFLAHNHAAAWYALSREPKRANDHFKLLRGHVTEYPWRDLLARSIRQGPVPLFRGKRVNALLRLPF
ncbi:hypothetical protein [Dactylosporangium sp. NPDC048998]|uniref:hypothetical protein n=1 Tax=Dactylosporangium sp. NPDC048998 TaxID=3363976 RepID=UPI003714BDD4